MYERTAGFLVIFQFYKPLQQKVGKNVPSKYCGRHAGKQVRETPIFQSKRSPLFTSPQTLQQQKTQIFSNLSIIEIINFFHTLD